MPPTSSARHLGLDGVAPAERHRDELTDHPLAMTQGEFSRTFRKSPMKRAKLRGLKRNAAGVLGNVGTAEEVDVLTRARDDAEPLVGEHAAWALARIGTPGGASASRARD